eukprot:5694021-Karenia_brevis.AAC.1
MTMHGVVSAVAKLQKQSCVAKGMRNQRCSIVTYSLGSTSLCVALGREACDQRPAPLAQWSRRCALRPDVVAVGSIRWSPVFLSKAIDRRCCQSGSVLELLIRSVLLTLVLNGATHALSA